MGIKKYSLCHDTDFESIEKVEKNMQNKVSTKWLQKTRVFYFY